MTDSSTPAPSNSPLPDDNGLLSQAALLAGAIVAVIRHSGRHGTRQEFVALIAALEAAQFEYPDNELIQRTLNDKVREQADHYAKQYATPAGKGDVQDFKMAAVNRAAQAADWLEDHVPAGIAHEWKHAMLAMCQTVAEASKEGGIFGIGVEPVDDFEVGVMLELRRALRYEES